MVRLSIYCGILTTSCSLLIGCEGWNHHMADHWEQGKNGAAEWKVNNDRDAQDHILELEKTNTRWATYDADYEKSAYNAISHLLATAHPRVKSGFLEFNKSDIAPFDSSKPVLYSTTVDLNDYTNTTNFGRLQSELLATALVQHWQNDVMKMTIRSTEFPIIPQEGEFILSRDVRDLAESMSARAVLVSTYSVSIDKVYINVQLVDTDSYSIVGAVSYSIPTGPRTRSMLKNIQMASENGDFLR